MSSSDEAIVFETANTVELGMIKSLLEAAGIPHVVHGGSASSFLGAHLGAGMTGLQRVAVRKVDEERALDLFDDALGSEGEVGGEG